MAVIRTIAKPVRHEIPKVRGSRFLATVAATASLPEVTACLDRLRLEFRDATHNCFAWRLGQAGGDQMRYSDDGEPSGTAGRPILQEIDGRDLTHVTVVVTRYYGGTKLGTGGLIRAYSAAAAAGLELAGVVEQPIVQALRLVHGYDDTGAVKGVLTAFDSTPESADYGAQVTLSVAISVEQLEAFELALRDATQGRIEAHRI